jgi:hypothetical protein
MYRSLDRYASGVRIILISLLIASLNDLSAQEKPPSGLTQENLKGRDQLSIPIPATNHLNYSHITIAGTLRPSKSLNHDPSLEFFDSLRLRASRKLITRKLYDFLIVSNQGAPRKEISGSSDQVYQAYSGRRIRKIEIQRLNVFGTNINSPLAYNPDKIEKFINATHINTNERIIRKNLLFREKDTISPLIISDNERLIRQLPFIDDARIIIVPVSESEADVVIITKDVYSLGAAADIRSFDRWSTMLFDKNIFGVGHEVRLELSADDEKPDNPGIGMKYNINNLFSSFANLNLFYFDGLGEKTYGFNMERRFISAATKYGGGISIRHVNTYEDLDSLAFPEPSRYNLQDYWFGRSFLIDPENVSRIMMGIRYTNNNVFDRPFILPDSYYYLQDYSLLLGSISFSMQRFYKTNLLYSYGRTEDIPYGGMLNVTAGRELNEFKQRYYTGILLSIGRSVPSLGYFYSSAGVSAFLNQGNTEQGLLHLRAMFFSNLNYLGSSRIRGFVKIDYTRGFDRYTDENLMFIREDGFSGFSSDSARGQQRLAINLESVLFSPKNYYGFKFAFFGFADLGLLFGTNEIVKEGQALSSIGIGVRIRNDNLVLNTFQLRLGYFPNLPPWSSATNLLLSGEKVLRPYNFEPGPPSILPYR